MFLRRGLMYFFVFFFMALSFKVNALHLGPDFYNSTAPGWQFYRNAYLTSPSIDPEGEGWLRLTNNSTYLAGNAVSRNYFSSSEGLEIEFEYTMFNGSSGGGDGFSVYLADGVESNPFPTSSGSALGYSINYANTAAKGNGVPRGYLGIGFDLVGAFSHAVSGGCQIPCGVHPNSVAIRGKDKSVNGSAGFDLLAVRSVPNGTTLKTTSNNNPKSVRITLTKPPQSTLTVELDFKDGAGYVKMIEDFDIVANNGPIPSSFRLGFGAATGQAHDAHQIRLKRVAGAQKSTMDLTFSALKSCGPVTFTATVSKEDINNPTPTGEVVFNSNGVEIGRAGLVDGVAMLTASLSTGMNEVEAMYAGDSVFAASVSSVSVDRSAADCPVVDVLKFTTLDKTELVPQNGSVIPYAIYVDNLSNSTATDISFFDNAPDSLVFGQWQCAVVGLESTIVTSVCPANLPVGNINIDGLSIGAKERLVFSVDASVVDNSSEMRNTARISFSNEIECRSGTEAVPGNQGYSYCESSVSFPPSTTLDIYKFTSIPTNSPPENGSIVPYTIRVSNEGSWDSNQVIMRDIAPAGLLFRQWNCRVVESGSSSHASICPLNLPSGNLIIDFDIPAGAVLDFFVEAEVVNNQIDLTNEAFLDLPSDTACVNDDNGIPRDPCSSRVVFPLDMIRPVPFTGWFCFLLMSGILFVSGSLLLRKPFNWTHTASPRHMRR